MKKKKRFSVLKLLIVIICITSVIASACANLLFANGKTPEIFGRHIYVVGEDNPMSGDITTGSALISMDAQNISIATGDIVLCYPADAPNKLTLRSISFIAQGDNGAETYYTKDSYHEDTDGSITKNQIVAVCTGYPESIELGNFITFARSLNGILILLGVPAIILLLVLITTIIRSRSEDEDEDEEDFGFYEYDEEEDKKEKKLSYARNSDPLYEPNAEAAPNSELERKKMSIAENFKQKEVNPDSPYQKEKEKERTMQFMAQKNLGTSTAESSFASRNPNTASSAAPTAETLREEMLRKTADTERTGTYNIRKTPDSTISDNTGILSTAQVAEMSGGITPSPAREAISSSNIPAPRKSSSPDISDIIGKGTTRSSKSPSDMSVDDLLKIIAEEKSKL